MARAVERLKALSVERLAKKVGLHADGKGLYLRVTSATARSWVLRYMLDGKAREMGLGPYPDVSLAEARQAATEARKQKAQGRDPIQAREAQRAAARAEAARAITFRKCAEDFLTRNEARWRNDKHRWQWSNTLERFAYPELGNLPVSAIDTPLIVRALEPIWTSMPETASRVRQRVEAVLDAATVQGYREGANPARWKANLAHLLPAHSKVRRVEHHAALPHAELPAFLVQLKIEGGTAARALHFTILSAARTGEVLGATWSEIDFDNRVWIVPAERMKAGKEHRVPLSETALELLRVQRKDAGEGAFVFPGARKKRPLSNMAMLQTLRRMKRGDLTVHGFRSTFRDWAAERTSFPREVAEAALAHTLSDKVEAAYRRSDLFDKRRKLMDAWAKFCATPVGEAKVVPFNSAKQS